MVQRYMDRTCSIENSREGSTTNDALLDSPHQLESVSCKITRIKASAVGHDLHALGELSISKYGLINDECRRYAWPKLLGFSDSSVEHPTAWRDLPSHRDEDQVRLDADRSFIYESKDSSEKVLEARREDLYALVVETLRRHPALCYFQGYHDIVQVLLLVLGRERATVAVPRLSLLRLRDFMLPNLSPAISHLRLLPSILRAADPVVEKHLSQTEPFFALAATLTLYAHEIQEYGDIARLFDFLLATEAVMSIYLFAVIIISRKEEILEIEADEPDMLHSVLSKLPQPLDLELLISQTLDLYQNHPPEKLPGRAWLWISSNSVLKTTRDSNTLTKQTLEDGERMFSKQSIQLRIFQSMSNARKTAWRIRRPAGAVGVAVLATFISWWLQSRGVFSFQGSTWQRILSLWHPVNSD